MIWERDGIRMETEMPESGMYVLCGEKMELPGCVTVTGMDWNRDLSPWPAPAAFARSGDFAGGGAEYLKRLMAAIEAFEAETGGRRERRCLAGYSLAGLFCLYAACETDAFEAVASVSGSLWYDGFLEYIQKRPMKARRVYLSLGDRESRARDPRLARVGECTLAAERIFRAQGLCTRMEWNPGNHFQDPTGRMKKAVDFLNERDYGLQDGNAAENGSGIVL